MTNDVAGFRIGENNSMDPARLSQMAFHVFVDPLNIIVDKSPLP
jgi:hypothetical protein